MTAEPVLNAMMELTISAVELSLNRTLPRVATLSAKVQFVITGDEEEKDIAPP